MGGGGRGVPSTLYHPTFTLYPHLPLSTLHLTLHPSLFTLHPPPSTFHPQSSTILHPTFQSPSFTLHPVSILPSSLHLPLCTCIVHLHCSPSHSLHLPPLLHNEPIIRYCVITTLHSDLIIIGVGEKALKALGELDEKIREESKGFVKLMDSDAQKEIKQNYVFPRRALH